MSDGGKFMRRALQLARYGRFDAHPNPMVGAVITDRDGKIIGEGWHRRCGEGHAEVNAVASVADKSLLRDATMYVTLEPCSHYGKTPPCAELIIRMGIPRVVVGCLDPFVKVSGRGVRMLRDAGVDVTVGVLEDECEVLNVRFMTAHRERRPYIILKWAESADGFIDGKISTPLTKMMVHRLRATVDGIMVGSGTALADDPRLDTRKFPGRNPRRILIDGRGRVPAEASIFRDQDVICFTDNLRPDLPSEIQVTGQKELPEILETLYTRGVTTLLVEGGAGLLQSFLDADLYDEIRIEQGPDPIDGKVKAPEIRVYES